MRAEYRYQVGGSLGFHHPTYVTRLADRELLAALRAGEFCYVLNSRQMGKSSLRVRTMQLLKAENCACAAIDMTRIGSKDVTPDQWYKGLTSELERALRLLGKIDKNWWQQQEGLSAVQRLSRFIEDILLVQVPGDKIIIFLDEIDSILSLDFEIDDFFALIRCCYNQRSENSAYQRLTFALFGVATPVDLMRDKTRTPFNIGCAIELTGFSYAEAQPLVAGLEGKSDNPQAVLQEILYWTAGQPFLTQKLCQLMVSSKLPLTPGREAATVAELVRLHLIESWEATDEPVHLRTIRDRLIKNEQRAGGLLRLYQSILQQGTVAADDSPAQRELCLSGLVVRHHAQLQVYNPIYKVVFNRDWVERQLAQLRPYHQALVTWEVSHYEDTSRLLRGQTLQEALAWATDKALPPLDYKFLNASQELERQESQIKLKAKRAKDAEARLAQHKKIARQQRYFLMAVSGALLISLISGVTTFFQYRQAKKSEIQAIITSAKALFASNQKLDALIAAIRAKQRLKKLGNVDEETRIQAIEVLQQAVDGVQEYNRLSGHSDVVWAVDFSSDGQIIATGSRDKTVKLWHKNGSLIRTLRGHSATVAGVAFSPDGKTIASASGDATVKLWRLDGTLVATLKGHSAGVIGVDFSPDGETIVTGSRDNTVKVWRRDGTLVRTLKGHSATVVRVAFSPDGDAIASASDDKTVKLWQPDGTLLNTLRGHQDEVYGVAFSPDGNTIASASDDKTVKLWHQDGRLLTTLSGHQDEVYGVAFSPDGKTIATGSRDKTVKLWRVDGTLLTTLTGHNGEIWQVAFSPDGQTIASASNDSTVKLWRPESNWLKILNGHSATVMDVEVSPDGEAIASGSGDNTVKLWRRDGTLVRTFSGHTGEVKGVAISPDGKAIASASDDKTIRLWQPNGSLITILSGHSSGVNSVDFSRDGKMLASASVDNTIILWNLDRALNPDALLVEARNWARDYLQNND
ncbi:MAG TPA: hypothetical protein DDZ80_25910 [Cyanobacteria bacterium UBA8803]|nr:hypothetical protein [Cyanobacteria bacterium UBA9273]HBL61727.1 hypothetical protein [Cyanobacteria bacterium UBA8803]